MTLNDKVNTAESTTGTSSSNTYTQRSPCYCPRTEQGWECPRCGRINAPWVRQCDCSRSNWTVTCGDPWKITPSWTGDRPDWWKDITYDSDTFRIHPESAPIYQAGGSDYWDYQRKEWVNTPSSTCSNATPNPNVKVELWNSTTYPPNCHTPNFTSETVVTDGINNFYNLKETK